MISYAQAPVALSGVQENARGPQDNATTLLLPDRMMGTVTAVLRKGRSKPWRSGRAWAAWALRERVGFMNCAHGHASVCLLSWCCQPVVLSTEGCGLCFGRESRARHVLGRLCIPLFCVRLAERSCMVCSLVCDIGSGSSAGALVSLFLSCLIAAFFFGKHFY